MEAAQHPWPALGLLMLRDGLIEKDELEALLAEQTDVRQRRITSWRLGEILVERGTLTEEQVTRLVAEQYELPYVELDADAIDATLAARLPDTLSDRFTALPTEVLDDGSVVVAVCDPATVLFSDELRKALGMPVRFAVAAPAALRAAIVSARSEPPQPQVSPSGASVSDLLRPEEPTPARSASALDPPATGAWPPLGALLVRDGLVSEEELEAALAQQRLSPTKRLGEILVERGAVSRADIARVVAEQYGLPFLDVVEGELAPEVVELLPLELGERYGAVAVERRPDGGVLVAVADPTTILDPSELASQVAAELAFVVADPGVVESALRARRGQASAPPEHDAPVAGPEDELEPDPAEPGTVTLTVVPAFEESADETPGLATVVPLNGHDAGTPEREPEPPPAATLRTLRGHAVTLPSLPELEPETLEGLGLAAAAVETIAASLAAASGLVVVAGRPHAGAKELAHALLGDLTGQGRSVLAVEDSVTHMLPGVDHVEAGPETGLTRTQALARVVRTCPDAVFVSDVADERMADLVAWAAERAVVVTTVRMPTLGTALRHLGTLGMEPAFVTNAFRLGVTRSELRRICVECRESYFASAAELAALGRPDDEAGRRLLGRGCGCEHCGATGFDGSQEVVELVSPSDDVRHWLANGAAADEEPAGTLRADVVALCLDGVTTVAEASRVLGVPGL